MQIYSIQVQSNKKRRRQRGSNHVLTCILMVFLEPKTMVPKCRMCVLRMMSVPMPVPETDIKTISTPDISMGTISWKIGILRLGANTTSQTPICPNPISSMISECTFEWPFVKSTIRQHVDCFSAESEEYSCHVKASSVMHT